MAFFEMLIFPWRVKYYMKWWKRSATLMPHVDFVYDE